MLPFTSLLVLAAQLVTSAYALSEYDAVVLVKSFADSLMAPQDVSVARQGNSTLFAPDVQGRIDILGDVQGSQLATESMFGLFASAAEHADVPSVIGSPVAYNVTNLAVQRNIVSASILLDLNYTQISRQLPLELGAWFLIDNSARIAAYDITFHRWTSAIDSLMPDLLPAMAKWSDPTNSSNSTDPSAILRRYLGRTICGTSLLTCAGHGAPWTSVDACTAYVTNATLGSFDQLGADTLACRAIHASLASLRPEYHCAAMGPQSTSCVNQDYAAAVKSNYFAEGFVAPKVVTPENEDEIGDYQVVNGVPITPLLKISLFNDSMKSWEPTLFATATFVYMLSLWVVAKLVYLLYNHFSKNFKALPNETLKTNVVMYVMNIFYTTVAVALQCVAIPAFWGAYDLKQVLCMRSAAIIISGLYCFELIFRFDMRLPLVAHHIFTIFAICFAVTLLEVTQDMTFMLSGIIWLCQATTEQPTFLGLYYYRMAKPSPAVANLLRAAAVQTFIFKFASAIGVIVVWYIHQKTVFHSINAAWSAMVFTISVGLMTTQVWGSWVTWKLGDRVMSKYRKSLNRRSSTHRTGKPDRRPSLPPRDISLSYTHDLKALETPLESYEPGNPYAEPQILKHGHGSGSDSSAPSSPVGSYSSKRPIITSTSTQFTPGSLAHLHGHAYARDSGYFARPISASPSSINLSLEPYGRSQSFGAYDSAWDLNGNGNDSPSASGSRAATPYGSALNLPMPQGAAPAPAHGGREREQYYYTSHRNRSTVSHAMQGSMLGTCVENEVTEHAQGHAQGQEQPQEGVPGRVRMESSASLEVPGGTRPGYDRTTTA